MSSDVGWHIRDKLRPVPKHGFNIALRPRKPEGSLGRTAQDGHLDSHTAPELWTGWLTVCPCWGLNLNPCVKFISSERIRSVKQPQHWPKHERNRILNLYTVAVVAVVVVACSSGSGSSSSSSGRRRRRRRRSSSNDNNDKNNNSNNNNNAIKKKKKKERTRKIILTVHSALDVKQVKQRAT